MSKKERIERLEHEISILKHNYDYLMKQNIEIIKAIDNLKLRMQLRTIQLR